MSGHDRPNAPGARKLVGTKGALLAASLLAIGVLSACGDKRDTTPPAAPPGPTASERSSLAATGSTAPATPWDLGSPSGQQPKASKPLPMGLEETFADWTVKCAASIGNSRADCALSQQQFGEDGRRVLAIAINPVAGEGLKGLLVTPLGLALDSGIAAKIDDFSTGNAMRFHTCIPTGCLVELELPEATVKAWRAAASIHLSAMTDNDQAAAYTISMSGFAQALDRALAVTEGN